MLKYSDNRVLPKRFADTAEILFFFNDLFDSFNGSCTSGTNQLKDPVTENSIHFEFWNYALCVLSKMKFLDATTGKQTNRTSVLQHFQSTIRGYIEVCKKCFKLDVTEVSISYFMLNFVLLCTSPFSFIKQDISHVFDFDIHSNDPISFLFHFKTFFFFYVLSNFSILISIRCYYIIFLRFFFLSRSKT